MTKEEIQHLGTLARIRLTDAEITAFKTEITSILGYVGSVNEIVADVGVTKRAGALRNVFRADEVTNEPESYTEALLREMPARDGRYLAVKKILNPDE